LPGRVCHKAVDECADPNLNTCDRNAACFDDLFGYRCQCLEGYLDISPVPTNPGRACKKSTLTIRRSSMNVKLENMTAILVPLA
ncbi:Transmembrane cell adhesion receptor mua-3, partial [Trichinella zimbabwensis]